MNKKFGTQLNEAEMIKKNFFFYCHRSESARRVDSFFGVKTRPHSIKIRQIALLLNYAFCLSQITSRNLISRVCVAGDILRMNVLHDN